MIDRSEAFIFEQTSVREPDEQEKQLALECHKTPQFKLKTLKIFGNNFCLKASFALFFSLSLPTLQI